MSRDRLATLSLACNRVFSTGATQAHVRISALTTLTHLGQDTGYFVMSDVRVRLVFLIVLLFPLRLLLLRRYALRRQQRTLVGLLDKGDAPRLHERTRRH